MATPEASFKTALREAFERLYGKKSETSMTGAIGVALGQPSGLPDRYFGAEGQFTWLEAKVDGCHKVTPIQQWQMARLAKCGQQVVVATLLGHKLARESWTVRVERITEYMMPEAVSTVVYPWSAIKTEPFWRHILRWK